MALFAQQIAALFGGLVLVVLLGWLVAVTGGINRISVDEKGNLVRTINPVLTWPMVIASTR